MKSAFVWFLLALCSVSNTTASFTSKHRVRKQRAFATALFSAAAAAAAGDGEGGVVVTEQVPAGKTYTGLDWHGVTCALKQPIYKIKPVNVKPSDSASEQDPDSPRKNDMLSPTCLGGLVWEKHLGAGAFGRVCRMGDPSGCIALGEVRLPTPEGGHKKLALKIIEIGGLIDTDDTEREVCAQSYAAEYDIAPHVYGAWYCGGRMYIAMDLLYASLSTLPAKERSKTEVLKSVIGIYERGLDAGFYQKDSHGGNIAFGLDGKVKLIDFGIVGFLPRVDWANEAAKKDVLQSRVARYTNEQMREWFGVTWEQYEYGSSRAVTFQKVVDVPEGVENQM